MQEIISTNNAKIKYLVQLQKKSSYRKEFKEFVIEGKREIEAALRNGYHIKRIFFNPELFDEQKLFELLQLSSVKIEVIKINKNVYKKIAYRHSTEGIVALAKIKEHKLTDFITGANSLILVAENIEKPGNIGAMLRSVDGAGATGLILVNPLSDLYNPNLIRSSIGTVFSTQIAVCDLNELNSFITQNQINLFAAGLQNTNMYFKEDFTGATAIAVGSEDKGLSNKIREMAIKSIYIPMRGQTDSLNVSVSAAILLYEAVKQRLST